MNMAMKMMVGVAIVGMLMGAGSCGRGYAFTPNQRCRVATDYCTLFQGKICCHGLYCDGEGIGGTCKPIPGCFPHKAMAATSSPKTVATPNHCSSYDGKGRCVPNSLVAHPILPM